MATEIEHKHLVINDSYKQMAISCHRIRQGYLSDQRERTVRVRTYDDKGFLTIKGANHGATRLEYEYEIPLSDALEMLNNLCHQPIIVKNRYIVAYNGNKWEIDEFEGNLSGLVTAEIEIPHEEYQYSIPPFVGKDVTSDVRYYNSNLSKAQSIPE